MALHFEESGLRIAKLQVIDAKRLIEGATDEAAKLLEACRKDGFFYLDVSTVGPEVALCVERMYGLEKELYSLPDEVKMLYDIDDLSILKLNGYKPVGRNFGGIRGKSDGFETYAIPNDGIMGLQGQDFERPEVIDEYMMTLRFFSTAIAATARAIFTSLSKALDIPKGEGLEDVHRTHVPSPDIIRLLKYHAQPFDERGASHAPHTDLGSLTFLFTQQPGLQVLCHDDQWAWVEPREGHAIVNLGDGMRTLSNGYLHSCLHRVGPMPGRAMEERYSFAYLMRAEDTTLMTGLKSPHFPPASSEEPAYTSGEWIQRKFSMLRGASSRPDQASVLTGGKLSAIV